MTIKLLTDWPYKRADNAGYHHIPAGSVVSVFDAGTEAAMIVAKVAEASALAATWTPPSEAPIYTGLTAEAAAAVNPVAPASAWEIDFSRTVNYRPAPQYLSQSRTVAVSGVADMSQALLTIVGDGVSSVSVSGAVSHDSDAGYLSTLGIVNTLRIWADGVKSYYAWSREANPIAVGVVDITPPTVLRAEVLNAAPTVLVLTMTEEVMAGSMPAAGAFTISGAGLTVSSVAHGGGAVVNLTLSSALALGDIITLSYTGAAGVLVDGVGNAVASFSGQAVTNSVGLNVVTRLTGTVTMTESGNATDGWSYIGTGVGFVNYGVADKSIPASVDGSFEITQSTLAATNSILGLDVTATSNAWANYDYGVYAGNPGASNVYTIVANSVAGTPTNNVAPLAGDKMRLRRSGTTLVAERLRSGQTSWDNIHTWTGVTTAQLYGKLTCASLATASNLRGNLVS